MPLLNVNGMNWQQVNAQRVRNGLPPYTEEEMAHMNQGGIIPKIARVTLPMFASAAGAPLMQNLTTRPNPNGGGFTLPPITINNARTGPTQGSGSGQGNGSGIPPWLLAILATAAGATSNSSSEATTTTSPTTVTSGQTLSPEATGLQGDILTQVLKQLNTDPDMTGYGANQLSEINRNYSALKDARVGELASRGITGPAATAAISGLDNERFAQGVQVRNQLPLLAQNARNQAIQSATGFYSAMPRTTTSTNSGNTSTTRTQGNRVGGGLTSLAAMLARMYGLNMGNQGAV